jgi:hypothetical protein
MGMLYENDFLRPTEHPDYGTPAFNQYNDLTGGEIEWSYKNGWETSYEGGKWATPEIEQAIVDAVSKHTNRTADSQWEHEIQDVAGYDLGGWEKTNRYPFVYDPNSNATYVGEYGSHHPPLIYHLNQGGSVPTNRSGFIMPKDAPWEGLDGKIRPAGIYYWFTPNPDQLRDMKEKYQLPAYKLTDDVSRIGQGDSWDEI